MLKELLSNTLPFVILAILATAGITLLILCLYPGLLGEGYRREDVILPFTVGMRTVLLRLRQVDSEVACRPEQSQDGGRVRDPAGRNHLRHLFERQRHDPDELRRLRTRTTGVPHRPAPEKVTHLRAAAGAGVDRGQMREVHGPVAGLLEELALRRLSGILPRIDPAARQLQREGTERLAPLAHQDHLAVLRNRHHRRKPPALEHPVLDGRPTR